MVTYKQVRRHIPKEAKFLSLGDNFCAYNLNGKIVTISYDKLFN